MKKQDKFRVTKVIKRPSEELIKIFFVCDGRTGTCNYTLTGNDAGIEDFCFDEQSRDVYYLIHDWVDENVSWHMTIDVNDKNIAKNKKSWKG